MKTMSGILGHDHDPWIEYIFASGFYPEIGVPTKLTDQLIMGPDCSYYLFSLSFINFFSFSIFFNILTFACDLSFRAYPRRRVRTGQIYFRFWLGRARPRVKLISYCGLSDLCARYTLDKTSKFAPRPIYWLMDK